MVFSDKLLNEKLKKKITFKTLKKKFYVFLANQNRWIMGKLDKNIHRILTEELYTWEICAKLAHKYLSDE